MTYGSVTLNPGTGGDVIATDVVAAKEYQLVKVAHGGEGVVTEAAPVTPFPVGFPTNTSAEILTTATLLGAAVYTSAEIDGSVYPFVRVTCFADQQGTIVLEGSVTTAGTFRTEASFDVRASSKRILTFEPSAKYYRLKFTNGATANTVFELQIRPSQIGHHDLGMVTLQKGCGFQDTTTTALGIAGTYSTPTADTSNQGQLITVGVYPDQTGTLYIEESYNNSSWEVVETFSVSAGSLQVFQHSASLRYVRARYVNGATGQTAWYMQTLVRTISIVDTIKLDPFETNTVVGAKSNNTAGPSSTNFGTLPAVAQAAAPSYTEANQVSISTTLSGDTRITLDGESVVVTATNLDVRDLTSASDSVAAVCTNAGTFVVQDNPQTSGGLSKFHLVSAATTNATNLKASAGQVYAITAFNINAAARYLKFHNTAGTPTAGSGVTDTYMIPGNTAGAGLVLNIDKGIVFATGIGITIVTGITDADATAVAASEIVVNVYYK